MMNRTFFSSHVAIVFVLLFGLRSYAESGGSIASGIGWNAAGRGQMGVEDLPPIPTPTPYPPGLAKANAEKGRAFFEREGKREGVVNHQGILYKVLRSGTGSKPGANAQVTVHYEGSTIDGQVFDSSYQRGKPVTFTVNQLIKGWQIAIPKMQVGETCRIVIPPELAYGEKGVPSIGPNATLVFRIELLEIQQ